MIYDEEDDLVAEDAQPLQLKLLRHQKEFVEDTTTKEIALVGGFGCGKTEALIYKAITLAAINAPYVRPHTANFLIEPDSRQLRGTLWPRFDAIVNELGIPHTKRLAPDIEYTLQFDQGDVKIVMAPAGAGAASFRSFEAAFIGVDESDTMPPEKLRELWVSLGSRLRGCAPGAHYQLFTTTTPEGYGFCYERFKEQIAADPSLAPYRRIIQGKTRWNPFLEDEYIEARKREYPAHLITAYLEGEFVNLVGKVVYRCYEPDLNKSMLAFNDVFEHEQLNIGIDFNVNGMSGIVSVVRDGVVHVIDELIGARGTQELAEDILAKYRGRKVLCFPDPACTQRKTSTHDTDLVILKRNGLAVRYMSTHPAIKDRVNSVNAMFENGSGERRLLINQKTCPLLVKCLRTQTWVGDKPKKDVEIGDGANATYIDGPVDALGYYIYSQFPLTNRTGPAPRLLGL